jgi:hypothetical protein
MTELPPFRLPAPNDFAASTPEPPVDFAGFRFSAPNAYVTSNPDGTIQNDPRNHFTFYMPPPPRVMHAGPIPGDNVPIFRLPVSLLHFSFRLSMLT